MDEKLLAPDTKALIPSRFIPPPSTVSFQLKASITAASKLPADRTLRAPETLSQWRGFIKASNEVYLERQNRAKWLFPCEVRRAFMGEVPVYEITPQTVRPGAALLLHFHGGAYVLGGGGSGLTEAYLGASYAQTRVLSVDYRMPPEHPYPAAVDDALSVWNAVIKDRAPASIGVFGTSAGGGLLLSLLMRLKALDLELPGAIAPSTPWTDLSGEGDTYQTNEFIDGVLPSYQGVLAACAKLYAGDHPLELPSISPVNADFRGFPPAILTSGTRDLLLSDTVRVYRQMRDAGVDAQLEVHEGMSHAEFNSAFDSQEAKTIFEEISKFFANHLEK